MEDNQTQPDPLLSPGDLSNWVGEPIQDDDRSRAQAVLDYAFTLIDLEIDRDVDYWRDEGLPEKVRHVALQVASRGYTNPESFTNERVDDWGGGGRPVEELGMYLTATEKRVLAKFAQSRSIGIGVIDTYKDEPEPLPPWFDPVTGGINDWK